MESMDLATEVRELKARRVAEALEAAGGNRRVAAASLGISLRTLFYIRRRAGATGQSARAVEVFATPFQRAYDMGIRAGLKAAERELEDSELRDDVKQLAVSIVRAR